MNAEKIPPTGQTAELETLREELEALRRALDRQVTREETLLETQRSAFQFLDAVPVGLFVIDAKGNPYYANQAAQQLLGKGIAPSAGPDQLAETYDAYLAGTDQKYPAARMPIVRALFGESVMVRDMEIQQPGRTIVLQVWGAPIYDGHGKLAYAIAAFSDISERREAEQRLAAQYAIARTLAGSHTLQEAVSEILEPMCKTGSWDVGVLWTVDEDAAVLRCANIWVNGTLNVSTFAGMTRQTNLGKGMGLPGRVWADARPAWIEDVRQEKTMGESVAALPDSFHGALAFPILIEDVVVGVAEFFSRHIRAPDDPLLQMMAAFGNQIGQFIERTAAEEQMRKARESAERAAQSKAEFLAIMSHEIRTPLNAVIGMTGLLLGTDLTKNQREYAETIRISGEALLAVINDILDFSKIESTRLILEEHPFALERCMDDAFDLIAQQALAKKIDLAYLVDADVPAWINGDITRLRQVLVNLTNNALKFTEQGTILVSVRNAGEHGSSVDLQFSVKDTGIGIPADKLDRLFKPFSQVERSTTRTYGGTGLGLAICSKLVELMGGTISVVTQEGEGSTFSFTIPVTAAQSMPGQIPRGSVPELRGKRILLVDDNTTHLDVLRQQAEHWGMTARATPSTEEALRWLGAGETFDLGVLDLQMPGMDGFGLATAIRAIASQASLPLVLLTPLGHPAETTMAAGGVFSATVTKPVKRSQLYEVIMGVLSGSEASTTLRAQMRTLDPTLASQLPLRILVAEDNPTNQKLMLFALDQMGYMADLAANGLEVLDALRRQHYDVVFMDIGMPEMDGLEATREIVQTQPSDRRPVIIGTTASALEGDEQRCREAGMDSYLTKPIRLEELQQSLERWGRGRPGIPRSHDQSLSLALDEKRVSALLSMSARKNPEVFGQLIDLYLEDFRTLLQAMKVSAETADRAELARAAHRLKGASLNLGVSGIADICQRIEQVLAKGEQLDLVPLLQTLEQSQSHVQRELEEVRRSAQKGERWHGQSS